MRNVDDMQWFPQELTCAFKRCISMHTPIRKAVFPVAGLGTRMFPASKSIPKEMLTLVDRPIIEWVVQEAREAGVEQFIFVTSRNKTSIEDHFDTNFELDQAFARKGDLSLLDKSHRELPEPGTLLITRQQKPLGLGHAIWCARHAVGNEPFAVLLPDMVMRSSPGCLSQMVREYTAHGGNIVATENVLRADVHRYGIVDLQGSNEKLAAVSNMVEKPTTQDAPSTAAISGRYILQPQIFDILANQRPGAGGEIQLTDAILRLLATQVVWAYRYDGQTFDCGDRFGFLSANVAMGLDHPKLGEQFRQRILQLIGAEISANSAEKSTAPHGLS